MRGKLVIACIVALLMGTADSKAYKSQKQQNIISLAQIHGKAADGWDDSYVSE